MSDDARNKQIREHCESQNCVGCPKEFECSDADSHENDIDCIEDEEYDGEE